MLRKESCLKYFLFCLLLGGISLIISSANAQTVNQQHLIRGVVTDESGEALIGATVRIKGSNSATVTDLDGAFSIQAATTDLLIVSYVGFEPIEVVPQPQKAMSIVLKENNILDEIVVVGYGTMKKNNLTGAVETVSSKELTWKPVGQTSMALQGVVPGVTVTQNSGQPGSDSGKIRIRGIGTMGTAGNNPLILVDGIETSLNSVDPNDIESISILKDAASSAIYGSRAANGVILVTTKRSTQKKIQVNYSGYVGWQKPTNMPKLVSGLDHMLLMNEANDNMGQNHTFQDSYIEEYRKNAPSDLYPDTDWQELTLTGSGLMTSHTVGISGGNDIISLRASVGYLNQKGIIPNTDYERYSLRINSDIKASKRLRFKLDILGQELVDREPATGTAIIFQYMSGRIPRNQEGILSDGKYGQGWLGINPIAYANSSGKKSDHTYQAIINASAEWEPIDNLKISVGFAPDFNINLSKEFQRTIDTYYGDGRLAYTRPEKSTMAEQGKNVKKTTIRALVEYSKSIKEHNFNLLAGYEQFERRQNLFKATRENFPLQDYPILSLGSEINQGASGSATENALRSYFGRVNYNYKQKYLFEANLRYDGSSRFAKGHRYGLFPSFSAAWRLSEESFMRNTPFDNLKLRVSWGQLGNQDIGDYPFVSSVNLTQNYILNELPIQGAALTKIGNPTLTWETTEIFNIGVDASFLNKINITGDFYVKNTRDILLEIPIPLSVGLGAPYQNAGKVRNIGWELGITHHNTIGNFNYSISATLSDVKNKIIDLKGTGPYISTYTIDKEGYPIGSYYGFEADGLFQTADEVASHPTQFGGAVSPGDIKYINQNEDNVITADGDRTIIGSPIPRYTYGLNFNANWKNFDLSVFFQGVGKADAYRSKFGVWAFNEGSTALSHHLDRWTPENPNASYPRLTFNYPNNEQVSDYWILDASYLRLKNLQIGYSLPKKCLKGTFINNIRVYASGQNLLTFDDFLEGFDVESPSGSSGFYPIVKTFTFGVDIQF